MKYWNYPSIIAIQNKYNDKYSFNFTKVNLKQINKEFLKLDVNKASQSSDISIKVLKENTDIFSNFLCNRFNNSIKLSKFPDTLKHADITHLYKKGIKDVKGNYRPVSVLPNLSKLLKNACLNKCYNFLKIYFRNLNVGFGRNSVPSNVSWFIINWLVFFL